ncbi:MAG: trypsin-like peptidase domain-containing protein [Clostridia bacterium]|nr:trypsin-like peptidase domain-containing protein [Clostridia bacterium]
MTEYNGYTQPKPKSSKTPLIITVAICTVVSLVVGIIGGAVGGFIAGIGGNKISGGTGGGTAVIYRDVTLRDQSGNDVENALSIGEVAEATRDSVVEITTEAVATGNFMMQYVAEGAGSGVIMTQDGYIVTNHHVIEGATSISVRTTNGESYNAKLIGSDARTDLAVIKIEASGLKSAVVGDFEKCRLGDTVVAIGNPLGQLGGTVTDGIISALDREITIDDNIMTLIQTNTAINPGNSGGGLFNTSGQLIGVVNAKSSGEDVEGLGFAIPIDLAQTVIQDLIEYGYVTGRVDTGIEVLEISDFQSAMYYRVSVAGLYVYSVTEGSEAHKNGFKSGDRIVSIDGKEIKTDDDYNAVIESHKIGDVLSVTVDRGGREQTLTLVLYEYKPKA